VSIPEVVSYLAAAAGLIFGLTQWRDSRSIKRTLSVISDELRARHPEGARQVVRAAVELPDASDAERERLADAISGLPEREKLVVTLYYYEELTMAEIAEVLGVSPSRISQIHARAIQRLKAGLAPTA
jgi:RNA polymerase sigma factor (sigma-70 family)